MQNDPTPAENLALETAGSHPRHVALRRLGAAVTGLIGVGISEGVSALGVHFTETDHYVFGAIGFILGGIVGLELFKHRAQPTTEPTPKVKLYPRANFLPPASGPTDQS